MSHLVSDLLLLSRLDAGKIRLNLQPVLASEALAQARHDAARLAAQKNVSVQVAGTYDGLMMADPERIQQVLMAILDNAIRHTPADGQIMLEARQHGNKIALVVTDTGEGIPPQKLPYVFERFYQADAARTQGSAGLGLSIARTLIEAMRGSIQLSSEPGRGTQVTLLLPCASSRQRS
ncbi:MAG: sensor histidine kinase [Candidatus Roseilinea sp.]|uniref:sensor histidine kinase n=1 Tax=Candidatus Roseilinea sp. TaxID=2838777 RepID=UPI00404934F6